MDSSNNLRRNGRNPMMRIKTNMYGSFPAATGRGVDKVIYKCGDVQVDPANRLLSRDTTEIALEPKAFSVLLLLLERAGELVTRQELVDGVWGHHYITPATLNRVMKLLRRAFDDDANQPRFVHTVHGAGYRFIGAVERVAVPGGRARATFGPPVFAQLPARLDRLIGRERDIAKLAAMLALHRVVTVIGPGGMGKTQCALEVARHIAADFPDGVWFFDLSPLGRSLDWLMALARTLQIPAGGTPALLSRTIAALAGRRALLLLDNCDRIAPGIGELVFELLRACPDLRVMTTSQRPLNVIGEQLMWLPPLALPPPVAEAAQLRYDQIASIPSVALLLARAGAVQPAITLGHYNVADVVEICRRLDGMPLAIELAAAQFATLSPTMVRERLGQRLNLLASDSAGREPRHQTLQALVTWSYDLLSLQEQRLLCWLGVFVQGWTIEGAEAIGSALGFESERLLELHSALVLKSLVVIDSTLSPTRYRLLETVREFALQLLKARGEESAARAVHLRYFVNLAERSHREILDARTAEWVARLRHEHANIEGAMAWAKGDGRDDENGLRLAGGLMLYAKSAELFWLLNEWVGRALAGVAPKKSMAYWRALLCSGMAKLHLRDASSEPHLAQAAALAASGRDSWTEYCACGYLAMWNADRGRLDEARTRLEVAERVAQCETDDWLRSLCGLASAWIALASSAYGVAVTTLAPLRRIGYDLQQHAMIEIYLGLSNYGLGLWGETARFALEVLELSLRKGNVRSAAAGIELAGLLAVRVGEPAIAARLFGKSADIRERTHTPLFTFWIGHNANAMLALSDALGSAVADALYREGASARDEDLIEDARALLRDVARSNAIARPVPA
jgi:predicted ATPase/DNA-binding winged helix-turn-helix (wHTH) protein